MLSLKGQIVVYVQALPTSIPSAARKFENLESCEFEMSHSSKKALAFATSLGIGEIMAVGFSPILQEAIMRGATSCKALPLCDDPCDQASFFPEEDKSDIVIVGENPEWVFTGASLAGFIAQARNKPLLIARLDNIDKLESSVILVRDGGESSGGVDIRRVKSASEADVNSEGVLGSSVLLKEEVRKSENVSGTPTDIAFTLSRKIRRVSRV